MSRAAERLFITQSAASHALRGLEERLKVRLFHRERRRMRPTPEGRRLLETAQVVLEEVQRAEHDLEQFRDGCGGPLRVATECYTCYSWLPRILESFMRDFPGVEMTIVPEATEQPVEALVRNEVDLAILHRRAGRRDIVEEPLFTDELVAVLPQGHRLCNRPYLVASDFEQENLILHSNPEDSVVFTDFLLPAGVRPRRVSQLRLTEAVVAAVRSGLGVTALAQWVVTPLLEGGGLATARLGSKGMARDWSAAMLKENAHRLPLQELVRLLREHARPLEPAKLRTA